jgi:hypothetical protein
MGQVSECIQELVQDTELLPCQPRHLPGSTQVWKSPQSTQRCSDFRAVCGGESGQLMEQR